MRSSFAGLNTMVSGIQVHQLGINNVGNNLTNDVTPGYSRERVNIVTTPADSVYGLNGKMYVGSGADAASITRIRDSFLDKHYWHDNSSKGYYDAKQGNYNILDSIFNDTQVNNQDVGLKSSIEQFWKSWQTLSTDADNMDDRLNVRNMAQNMTQKIRDMAGKLQSQLNTNYNHMKADVIDINNITSQILTLNKNIMMKEALGGQANELRDARDLLVDKLSKYMEVNVQEEKDGSYSISSNGSVIVNGKANLKFALEPVNNTTYGITDYNLTFAATGTIFNPPTGELQAIQSNVTENKAYIDKLADFSAFFLTTFNAQHREGYGIDGADAVINGVTYPKAGTTNINFFGTNANNTTYTWVGDTLAKEYHTPYIQVQQNGKDTVQLRGINIINQLVVSDKITAENGVQYIAAKGANKYQKDTPYTDGNGEQVVKGDFINADGDKVDNADRIPANDGTAGPADGSNAVLLSTLFNTSLDKAFISDAVKVAAGVLEKNAAGKYVPTDKFSSTGSESLYSYYNDTMVNLGTAASVTNNNVTKMKAIVTQADNMRNSISGVNWNDELAEMIKFQQGYSACARMMTTMDQMLDKLINGTGLVGRG